MNMLFLRRVSGWSLLACSALWAVPAVLALAFGIHALGSLASLPRSPVETTGVTHIVAALVMAIGSYGLVLGILFSIPASLMAVAGGLQFRKGIGHLSTIFAGIAALFSLLLPAFFLNEQSLRVGSVMLLIASIFGLHLLTLCLAFAHAEGRSRKRGSSRLDQGLISSSRQRCMHPCRLR